MEKTVRCTWDDCDLFTENHFKANELIADIQPLLTDYFECKQIALKDGAIEMEFYNGQRFLIKAEEQ